MLFFLSGSGRCRAFAWGRSRKTCRARWNHLFISRARSASWVHFTDLLFIGAKQRRRRFSSLFFNTFFFAASFVHMDWNGLKNEMFFYLLKKMKSNKKNIEKHELKKNSLLFAIDFHLLWLKNMVVQVKVGSNILNMSSSLKGLHAISYFSASFVLHVHVLWGLWWSAESPQNKPV